MRVELIECVDVTMNYGDVAANRNVNLSVAQNEIRAIVGENGAGKTTLMNVLYGLLSPTEGYVKVGGRRVDFTSPADAISAGLGMVHQHFRLVPTLKVFENVLLGAEILRSVSVMGRKLTLPFLNRNSALERVSRLIRHFGFNLDANALVRDISVGAKQKVEILKMLYRDVSLLIFDEPTAVLTPQEIDEFFDSLRHLKDQGKTIILITHKLKEVMDISDSVTVMKQGQVVKNLKTRNTDEKEIAQLMVGRDVLFSVQSDHRVESSDEVVYEVKNLSTENDAGRNVVDDVSLVIRKGEILGVAGVEGNGQSELVSVVTGLMNAASGSIFLNGRDVTNLWPKDLRDRRMGIIPEERYVHGLCADMTLSRNCIAGYHNRSAFCSRGLLRRQAMRIWKERLVEKYDIRVSGGEVDVSSLSGGNAQKTIIARELESDPDILIAAQPTRGVDIGAVEFIHSAILDLRKKRKAVLLVSSDLSEILHLSDRIVVMYKGGIIGEVSAADTTVDKLGLLMAGLRNG